MKTIEAVLKLKESLTKVILHEEEFKGEITLKVNKEDLLRVLLFFKDEIRPGYEVLMDLTGVDYIAPEKRTEVIYWLHNPTNFERVRIVTFINREESLPSVTHIWEGADWYERELYDMFGVKFDGHPDLKRILMPDDWLGHPLCRDYPLTEEPVKFKHGVKPKVPSEIIKGTTENRLIQE